MLVRLRGVRVILMSPLRSPWAEKGAGSCLLTLHYGSNTPPTHLELLWAVRICMTYLFFICELIYQYYSSWGRWHLSCFSEKCNQSMNFTWQLVAFLTPCGLKSTRTHWVGLLRSPMCALVCHLTVESEASTVGQLRHITNGKYVAEMALRPCRAGTSGPHVTS